MHKYKDADTSNIKKSNFKHNTNNHISTTTKLKFQLLYEKNYTNLVLEGWGLDVKELTF